MQKTAGTALWRRLEAEFEPAEVYPGPDDGQPPATVLSVAHLVERWRARADEIRIVTGHFPLCTIELLDGPFTTITLLREPVERTLSFLRHHRESTPEDRDLSLEEIYENPVRFSLVHDHMVKMLSLSREEMTDGAPHPRRLHPRPTRTRTGAAADGRRRRFPGALRRLLHRAQRSLRVGARTTDLHEPVGARRRERGPSAPGSHSTTRSISSSTNSHAARSGQ